MNKGGYLQVYGGYIPIELKNEYPSLLLFESLRSIFSNVVMALRPFEIGWNAIDQRIIGPPSGILFDKVDPIAMRSQDIGHGHLLQELVPLVLIDSKPHKTLRRDAYQSAHISRLD